MAHKFATNYEASKFLASMGYSQYQVSGRQSHWVFDENPFYNGLRPQNRATAIASSVVDGDFVDITVEFFGIHS